MKLSMICVVLAALAAVANAGSIDIKVQDKPIAITRTEDAWQQLVTPLSKVESKCCTTCTAPKNKYFSIAHDSGKWLCGETCIRDGFFPIFHVFEKNLTKAASRTASVCADAGYTVYDSTVTHGGGGLDCTLDLYACSKGEGNCEHPPAASMNAKKPTPNTETPKLLATSPVLPRCLPRPGYDPANGAELYWHHLGYANFDTCVKDRSPVECMTDFVRAGDNTTLNWYNWGYPDAAACAEDHIWWHTPAQCPELFACPGYDPTSGAELNWHHWGFPYLAKCVQEHSPVECLDHWSASPSASPKPL